MSDWGGEHLRQDARWKFGMPPVNNANYAWIQHFIHHLSPGGVAGFVMANGSMSTQTSNEGEIRKAIIEADLVDCIVALPGQLFYTTQIPVCLWFLSRNKTGRAGSPSRSLRAREGETLFIDARKMGVLVDRIHRELTAEEIQKIADTYHAWRSGSGSARAPRAVSSALAGNSSASGEAALPMSSTRASKTTREGACAPHYADEAGFCKSVALEEIRQHDYVLTPGRYVGAAEVADDGEPFEQKMKRLTTTLEEQFAEAAKLEKAIRGNLKALNL